MPVNLPVELFTPNGVGGSGGTGAELFPEDHSSAVIVTGKENWRQNLANCEQVRYCCS